MYNLVTISMRYIYCFINFSLHDYSLLFLPLQRQLQIFDHCVVAIVVMKYNLEARDHIWLC